MNRQPRYLLLPGRAPPFRLPGRGGHVQGAGKTWRRRVQGLSVEASPRERQLTDSLITSHTCNTSVWQFNCKLPPCTLCHAPNQVVIQYQFPVTTGDAWALLELTLSCGVAATQQRLQVCREARPLRRGRPHLRHQAPQQSAHATRHRQQRLQGEALPWGRSVCCRGSCRGYASQADRNLSPLV